MVVHTGRMSAAEFMALPADGNRHELVRGELRTVPLPPPGSLHGLVETALLEAISRYVYDTAQAMGWETRQGISARFRLVGFVGGGEFGLQFSVADDPSQIRGADGVYVPAAQYAAIAWDGTGYFPTVLHLVIEVISPSESATEVAEKVHDYLAGGAYHVWCVYLGSRAIHIHDAGDPTRAVHRGGSLIDEELLPGFALPLNMIFPESPQSETR